MPSFHHHNYHTSTTTNNNCHPLSHHHRHLVNYYRTTATLPHLLRYHQFANTTTTPLALNHRHHLFISYTTIISPPLLLQYHYLLYYSTKLPRPRPTQQQIGNIPLPLITHCRFSTTPPPSLSCYHHDHLHIITPPLYLHPITMPSFHH